MTAPHFLQTQQWAQFQRDLGRVTLTRSGPGWHYMAIRETGWLNTRLYVPYGPTFTDERALAAALDDLEILAVRWNVTFIRVEPVSLAAIPILRKRGFVTRGEVSVQPSVTRIVDLKGSESQIVAQMKRTTRPRVRNYAKKGISIRQSVDPRDIGILIKLLGRVSERNRVSFHSAEYFEMLARSLFPSGAASLFIAEVDNKVAAVSLPFDSGQTRIYAHAAADDDYRTLHVGTALVGEMMLDAARRGMESFDLYGITESGDPQHPWAGFTTFKEAFGGNVVRYAGMWELPIHRTRYRVLQLLRRVRSDLMARTSRTGL